MRTILALSLIFLLPVSAIAEKLPQPGPTDSRIRTVVYNPRDVIRITGHYGYQTLVQFANYEEIKNISIGDSLAWQVVRPKEQHNLLFVKPIENNAQTNLTVVTILPSQTGNGTIEQRIYNFALEARKTTSANDPNQAWTIQFEAAQAATQRNAVIGRPGIGNNGDPTGWNFNYTFAGDKAQVPVKVFDNGEFTYFQFDKDTDTPAIFLVAKDRSESLVNSVRQGDYLVVHRRGRQFTLRNGNLVTCIFNAELDQASPTPRVIYQKEIPPLTIPKISDS